MRDLIALGYRLRLAATALGAFLIAVTTTALQGASNAVAHPADQWLWDTLQRSNFVKNLYLLGVCIAALP